jgi:hypothetical protein
VGSAAAPAGKEHFMSDEDQKALAEVVEAMQFEHWLRFYFLVEEEGGALRMDLPQEILDLVRAEHAHLAALAEAMQGKAVDYQTSVAEVCSFLAQSVDGVRHRPGLVATIMDSRGLKLEMHLFTLWLSGHEAAFDEQVMPFAQWRRIFADWRGSKGVRDYLAKIGDAGGPAAQAPCDAVQ